MKKNIFKHKKRTVVRKTISFLVFIVPILLYGCNTMEGAGTDIKEAGRSLERAADKHKPEPCPRCYRRSNERTI